MVDEPVRRSDRGPLGPGARPNLSTFVPSVHAQLERQHDLEEAHKQATSSITRMSATPQSGSVRQ